MDISYLLPKGGLVPLYVFAQSVSGIDGILEALDAWADPFHWLVVSQLQETDGESLDKSTIVVMAGRVMAFLTLERLLLRKRVCKDMQFMGQCWEWDVILNKRNIQLLCVNMGPKTRK